MLHNNVCHYWCCDGSSVQFWVYQSLGGVRTNFFCFGGGYCLSFCQITLVFQPPSWQLLPSPLFPLLVRFLPLKYLTFWKIHCNRPLTTTQGDRNASCENIVSRSQTSFAPHPISDSDVAERRKRLEVIVWKVFSSPLKHCLVIFKYQSRKNRHIQVSVLLPWIHGNALKNITPL